MYLVLKLLVNDNFRQLYDHVIPQTPRFRG